MLRGESMCFKILIKNGAFEEGSEQSMESYLSKDDAASSLKCTGTILQVDLVLKRLV